MAEKYAPTEIEAKWQKKWAEDNLYKVSEDTSRPKWYALTMFPYTSGDLHIGHWYAMAPSDVNARFKRMQGYNVMHPMGFDAFGLPAENAAIKRGIHPYKWTMQNIENMRRQLKSIGSIYDWDREVISCLPEYYKWTQWFFLKLYEGGLAYRGKAPVNWCPGCQTVLANEQVVGEGVCERCGTEVIHRDLEQWFFRITKYADELMDLSKIEWPERIKIMQRNWIGRSEGAEISFGIDGQPDKEIRVFTTRPDTTYGVTFMVLAPEHPLVAQLTTPEHRQEVEEYITSSRKQTEIERLSTEKEKSGIFIGAYAINKLNGRKLPIFIADYVLLSYGTGAVMAVPAHDTRDFAFAKKYDIPIIVVVAPLDWSGKELEEAYTGVGTMVNSAHLNGISSDKCIGEIIHYMEKTGIGKRTISYKIRDWLISRQRYWGAPIPMIYCSRCGIVPVPEKELPVLLPPDAEFKPTGESPLKYCKSFVNTTCPACKGPAQRETDTMDTFMCSSWYFIRYASPHESERPFDPEKVKYWLAVDQYTGGAEHAVMHLLYARFFIKAIRDLGIIDFDEPFLRLFNQGTIIYRGAKMSKSRGNVITPDEYVSELGADSVRAYLMFVGPWEHGGEWNDSGINGIWRWLNRAWNLVLEGQGAQFPSVISDNQEATKLRRFTHKTIKRVTFDLERFQFNTMLSALMEFTNYLSDVLEAKSVDRASWECAIEKLMMMMAPSTPHFAEELWQKTGHAYSIHRQQFPAWDESLASDEVITLVIQINGKLRDRVLVPAEIEEEEAKKLIFEREKVQAYLKGHSPKKVIFVPGRLINIVI